MIDQSTFAKSALKVAYDLNAFGMDKESSIAAMNVEIDDLLALNKPEVLKRRHGFFQVTATTEEDYQERFFEVLPGKWILAGIRHLNGVIDQSFVQVFFGFVPTDSDLLTVQEFAQVTFHKFSPNQVSFWLSPALPLAQDLERKSLSARSYMVGRVSDLKERPRPVGVDRIELEEVKGELDFDWYEKAYESFHASHPELKDWVPLTDREDLQQCANEGFLFYANIDGRKAGLIGGYSESLLNEDAIYMTELLITSPHKGQGLAAALQRSFLESLPAKFQFVWGTIDTKNRPSLNTALKVGRTKIRTEFFLPI